MFEDLVTAMDRTVLTLLGEKVPIIYQPSFGAAVPVQGIFDDSFALAQGSAESGVEARVPTVFLVLADLPIDPEQDDPILTIDGDDYRVIERRPADFGSVVLALRKVG